jgi:hypothetical protein
MTGLAWAILGILTGFLLAAVGDLVSEEIRGWLDRIPHLLLWLAARLTDPAQRQALYRDEWLPELTYALHGAESRPITRLILGIRYSAGILRTTRKISRHLHRTTPTHMVPRRRQARPSELPAVTSPMSPIWVFRAIITLTRATALFLRLPATSSHPAHALAAAEIALPSEHGQADGDDHSR